MGPGWQWWEPMRERDKLRTVLIVDSFTHSFIKYLLGTYSTPLVPCQELPLRY